MPWKATGLECDKMNPEAVAFHLNHVLGELKKHCADVIGHGLEYLWFDSYEAGTPNWTPKMREEFRARRGYDLTPFLATFAKRTVGSAEESKRFAADFKRTIADLYRDVYFGVSAQLVHAAGLQIRSEPYEGPWVVSEVVPKFDQVAAEFWRKNGGKYAPYMVKEVVAGAHAAHQNLVTAEAFTAYPVESQWDETPEALKPAGDLAFCDGINRFMLHRFTHEPFGMKYRPGIVMGQWGTHFDRTQTWWEPGKAYVQYLTRCQGLLQWGEDATQGDDFRAQGEGAGSHPAQAPARPGGRRVLRGEHGARGPQGELHVCRDGQAARMARPGDGRPRGRWRTSRLPTAGRRSRCRSNRGRAVSSCSAKRSKLLRRNTPATIPSAGCWARSRGRGRCGSIRQWGGPAGPVAFDALVDWTARPEAGIRYFSGTAVYRAAFDLPNGAGAAGVGLDLGVVHDLARVRVNGVDLGVVWTAPWRVAVPAAALKPSGNQLEIEVTNCWVNRLVGDEQEPPDCEWLPGYQGHGGYLKKFPAWFVHGTERPSKGRYTFTTWNYFTKDSKLEPSGLLGPVRVVADVPLPFKAAGKDQLPLARPPSR